MCDNQPMNDRSNRVRITALAHGPHGVGRIAGKAVFVRGVAPQEEVEVRVREQHPGYDYADLVAVRRPSPDRRQPPCPYLPRCGGCPWQHLGYPAQLQAKQHNLDDALRRIAEMPELKSASIIAAPAELGYRGRLTLRVDDAQVGFYAGASHDLVAVEHCLLANEEVNAAISLAADLVRRLHSHVHRIEIAARGFAPGVVLSAEIEGPLVAADIELVPRWLEEMTTAAGVELHGKRWRRSWGDDRVAFAPEPGLELYTSAGSFSQVNPAANQLLVAQVLALAELDAHEAVLELYAGAGNLTIPIARRAARVVAVEQDGAAAERAIANADVAATGNVEVIAASARHGLRNQLAAGAYFDTVVLDPPRSGAAEIVDALLDLSPRKLVYVSCNPLTLARDLKQLSRKYRIDTVQPIDLFPQSYHLETITRATRR